MPENKVNTEQVLSSFLDQMVAAKGENLSKTERLILRQDLKVELDKRTDQAMIAALPDDKVVALSELMEKGASEEEIDDFLANAGVDFEKVVLQAILQFRKDYLRDVPEVKSAEEQAVAGAVKEPVEVTEQATAEVVTTSAPEAANAEQAAKPAEVVKETTEQVVATAEPVASAAAGQTEAAKSAASAATETSSQDMTKNTVKTNSAAPAPAGAPMQGTVSAAPGMSNVEGIARMIAEMSEGGQNA